MKTHHLFLLLTCLILISCSIQEQTPLYPTLEPAFFEAEGLGKPHSSDDPSTWVLLGWQAIYLKKGLTRAGKIQLERGQTSYFLLNFSTEPDKSLQKKIEVNDMKIIWQTEAYMMVHVKPAALSYLQQLTEEGTLKFGGPIPPRAKVNIFMPESLKRKSPSSYVNVEVRLLTQHPTEEEKAEVATWLDIEEEIVDGYNPLPLVPNEYDTYYFASGLDLIGTIKVEHIPYLLELPVVFDIKIPSPFSW